jgi:mannose-6-phosphate isomerase-like protein (cupin superfamily)
MSSVLTIPSSPSFASRGLRGYQFQPLKNEHLEVHFLDVRTGHDQFIISKVLTRIYYIIDGKGSFVIDNQKYDVAAGMLIEVPPGHEYCYSGAMKILLISNPRWFSGNEQNTRDNPDVVGRVSMRGLLSKIGFLRRWRDRFRRRSSPARPFNA